MPRLYWLLVMIFVGCRYVQTAEYETYSEPYLFTFVTTPKSWMDAKSECEAKRAVLVKIDSNTMNDYIVRNFPSSHPALWIGANDRETEGTWKWVADESSAQAHSDWDLEQPDNWRNEDCATINDRGKWNDCGCSRYKLGFVCQKLIVRMGWFAVSFSYDLKTWNQASQECQKDGYQLVKSHVNYVVAKARQKHIRSTWGRWIGFSDSRNKGDSARNRERPNGELKENCPTVGFYEKVNYSCTQKRKYICLKRMRIFTDQSLFHFSFSKTNWSQAKAKCSEMGFNLIRINSAALTEVVAANSDERAWIGLSTEAVTEQWGWYRRFGYQNWATGQPKDQNHSCVYAASNGKWHTAGCHSSLKYICEQSLPKEFSLKDHVFIFHRKHKVSWQDAKDACADAGSRLAEIHDTFTLAHIKSKIIDPTKAFYCIQNEYKSGALDSDTDDTFTALRAEGEHRSKNHSKMALMMLEWKAVSPTEKLPYICERANLTKITLSKANQTIGVGSDEEVICSADGIPFSEVLWKFSSSSVSLNTSDAVFQVKEKGRSVLHFGNATLTDEGIFTCLAKNRAGNFRKILTEPFHLKVPSIPDFVIAEALECSTTVTVKWKANARAQNINHKVVVTNAGNASEMYEIPCRNDITCTFHAGKSMIFNVTVTPCPDGVCKDMYAKRRAVGFLERVVNLQVQLSNKYFCSMNWEKSSEEATEHITNYKVIVIGRGNQVPGAVESSDSESSSQTLINGIETRYIIGGKPNVEYKIGIQAKTCAGYGDILWSNDSCVTEAPANPEVQGHIKEDGTLDVMINIPSQKDDAVRCRFVIVKVHNNENKVINDYTRNDLVQANSSSEEYIAIAFDIKTASGLSKLKMTLGEKQNTTCELSVNESGTKRGAINRMFVGRNGRLDQHSDHSIFIVTTFSIHGKILLTTSESVTVSAVRKPEDSGIRRMSWIIVVSAGSITLLVLILFGVRLLRKSKSDSSLDVVVQSVTATTNETATTSFCSSVKRDGKAPGNDAVDNKTKEEAILNAADRMNQDLSYIEPNVYQNQDSANPYEVVMIQNIRHRVTSYQAGGASTETSYAPRVLQLEERPEGYDSINIAPRQDQPNDEYSIIPEPNYEGIDVTETSP